MKKLIITLAAVLCTITAAAYADEPEIKLIVDNKIVQTETVSVNYRTLVPVRALMESTGAEVVWDEATQGIAITRGENNINLQIDNTSMTSNGETVTLDAAPVLYNDTTTYVPLRAICEAFNFNVDWDENTKTILISAPDGDPYVDVYGVTTAEFNENAGLSPEDFHEQTGLDYEAFKDKSVVYTNNSIPVAITAANNEMTVEQIRDMLGLAELSPDTPWGVAVGEASLRNAMPVIAGAEYSDELFEMFKAAYGLGNEYTGDTKYKYVRTIIETAAYESYLAELEQQAQAPQTPQYPDEQQLAEYEKMLPELCKNKISFTIILNDGGIMKGELYPDLAKETVANFVKLCDEKFYDGLIFHRVIDKFMIQGGGYDKDFKEKPADAIPGEFYMNGYINPLKHEKGVISMARTNDPNSATSQFFIMDEASPHLDGNYAAFGKITEGLEVINRISECETGTNELGMSDVPVKPIVIKSIRID